MYLPREIICQPAFYIALAPRGLEILFASERVGMSPTCVVIDQFEGPTISCGRNLPGLVLGQTPFEIVGIPGVEIAVARASQHVNIEELHAHTSRGEH